MKKIIIDFETTNISPLKANILEFSALFVEDNKVVEKFVKYSKFEKDWSKLEISEISALNFNKILSQEDLNKHNLKGRDEEGILNEFLEKVKEFSDEKLALTGWNNAIYDCIILEKIMTKYEFDFRKYFSHHSRDVMCMFTPFYEKYYFKEFKFHLSEVHLYLIGSLNKDEFHVGRNDCYATLDIDIWIEENCHKSKSCN